MDKLPEECCCMISSYLTKQDRSNLKLACKTFYECFSPGDWRQVTFSCGVDELNHTLELFLDKKKISVCLKGRLWPPKPPAAGLVKRLVSSLSKMVNAEQIKLCIQDYKAQFINGAEFSRLLAVTSRWDNVTTLYLECSAHMAVAALNHCNPDVLKNVSLNTWCGRHQYKSIKYLELQSMYSTQPCSLETLSIFFDPGWAYYAINEGFGVQVQGIQQVTEDFPGLKCLYILGPVKVPYGHSPSDASHYRELELGFEWLYEVLNSSSIEHFAIEINLERLDDEFKALAVAIGLHGKPPAECEDFFDDDGYLEESHQIDNVDLIQWYSNLTDRILEACPNLQTVRVCYKSKCYGHKPEPEAYTYGHRLDNGRTFTELCKGDWDHAFQRRPDLTSDS
ncbi:hypothetical protein FPOA_00873 [Fusarium poae]|uniref:F-box domain-containing protein n=1 Tax=Fusarium poae TaxID=36050 RepID=A0A1B8B2H3_FUSPO|nr:hypothetical protein FPOA_00873 [Fusarium poae]